MYAAAESFNRDAPKQTPMNGCNRCKADIQGAGPNDSYGSEPIPFFIQYLSQEKDLLKLGNFNGNHLGTWESIGDSVVTMTP